MGITTRSRYWGPHFPDVWDAGVRHWGLHFPDPGSEPDVIPAIGPSLVDTFVLDLESGLTVTLEYQTDVFKSYDGREKRAAVLDYPRRKFRGSALLIGSASVRKTRTLLARQAAQGATFGLGLPFEGLLLTADSVGSTLSVATLAAT